MAANRDVWFSSFAMNLDQQRVPRDGIQFVLTTVAFPKIYVCVEQSPGNDVWGKKAPQSKGLAVFTLQHIKSENGSPFKLSAIDRADWYIYTKHTDNYVKVSKKVENSESYWKMHEIDRDKKKKKFHVWLYTENSSGERVYAYMQDNEDHCVRCSTIEPGDNGVFIVQEVPK